VRFDHLAAYYVIEGGIYAYYEFQDTRYVLRWRSRRIAIAYDSDHMEIYRIGEPDQVMRWAPGFKVELGVKAKHFAISLVPPGMEVVELNRLGKDPSYGTTFLRKCGIV
jgi:hypothetical protein